MRLHPKGISFVKVVFGAKKENNYGIRGYRW